MNSNALVTIATYSFPHEAHLAISRLDAVGIPAYIADEHTITMQWLYSNALGGVKVQVAAEFVDKAKDVLQENLSYLLEEEFGKDEHVCPRSEERRVGKECRSRWWRYNENKKGNCKM